MEAAQNRKGVLAAFVAPGWAEQERLRVWAKTIGAASDVAGARPIVLLTDDASDGNNVLARQLRCSNVVCAIVRTPGAMRSTVELGRARLQRDLAIAQLADVIFDFGHVSGGSRRFPDKETTVIIEGQMSSGL